MASARPVRLIVKHLGWAFLIVAQWARLQSGELGRILPKRMVRAN